MLYLDHNATTACRPEVVAAMAPYWSECAANPQSLHQAGQQARRALDVAREQVRRAVGAGSDWEVIFTGSGTEADNLAIRGVLTQPGDRLITSPMEHKAVLASIPPHARTHYLPVTTDGVVMLPPETPWAGTKLLSLQLANNETGALQPVAAAAALARAAGAWVHSDTVQAVGRVPVDVTALGVDLLSLAAHKLGGPKGVGALLIRPGVTVAPLILGGSHERGLRAGTHNLPGIVGCGAACALATAELADYAARTAVLRDRLAAKVCEALPSAVVISAAAPRLPNTLMLAFPGHDTQTLLIALDLAGLAAGAGAACSAGGVDPSHVLAAMALPRALQRSVVRFSLGRSTTAAEIEEAATLISATLRALARRKSGSADLYA